MSAIPTWLLALDWSPHAAVDASLAIATRAPADLSAFYIPPASAKPFAVGSYVGAVAQGGSCNCPVISLCAHGNGTHTECLGHITTCGFSVNEAILPADRVLMCAVVLNIEPESLGGSGDEYASGDAADRVVSRRLLLDGWQRVVGASADDRRVVAVALNTGSFEKTGGVFSGTNPVYLTPDAAAFLREAGVRHVLVDLPSLDREDDGGRLLAHRAFWGVGPGLVVARDEPRCSATITELCCFPSTRLPEGWYGLSLHVAPLDLDAAPSRPVFIPFA